MPGLVETSAVCPSRAAFCPELGHRFLTPLTQRWLVCCDRKTQTFESLFSPLSIWLLVSRRESGHRGCVFTFSGPQPSVNKWLNHYFSFGPRGTCHCWWVYFGIDALLDVELGLSCREMELAEEEEEREMLPQPCLWTRWQTDVIVVMCLFILNLLSDTYSS